MAHPHEEHLRTTTDKLNSGDMDGFLAGHTDDVKFHVAGSSPMSGDHEGRDGVGRAFGSLTGILDAPPSADVHDCLANDEHGILLITQHLSRGGKQLDVQVTVVFHFRDGLVSEVWLQPRDIPAFDAFLS